MENEVISTKTPIWASLVTPVIAAVLGILSIVLSVNYFQDAWINGNFTTIGVFNLLAGLALIASAVVGLLFHFKNKPFLAMKANIAGGAGYAILIGISEFSVSSLFGSSSGQGPVFVIIGLCYLVAGAVSAVSVFRYKDKHTSFKSLDMGFGGEAALLLVAIFDLLMRNGSGIAGGLQVFVYVVVMLYALSLSLMTGLTNFYFGLDKSNVKLSTNSLDA